MGQAVGAESVGVAAALEEVQWQEELPKIVVLLDKWVEDSAVVHCLPLPGGEHPASPYIY